MTLIFTHEQIQFVCKSMPWLLSSTACQCHKRNQLIMLNTAYVRITTSTVWAFHIMFYVFSFIKTALNGKYTSHVKKNASLL